MRDRRKVAVDEEVGIVGDSEPREVLPLDVRVLRGARDEVSAQKGPCHGLRDTGLEVNGDGESAGELSEGELLTGLGGDRLREQARRGPRVEVRQEAVYAGLAPSGKSLTEVDKVAHGLEVVLVLALQGSCATTVGDDVADELCVADFLVGEELDEGARLGIDASGVELCVGKALETVVEQVELDPLLVQSKGERLEVDWI